MGRDVLGVGKGENLEGQTSPASKCHMLGLSEPGVAARLGSEGDGSSGLG